MTIYIGLIALSANMVVSFALSFAVAAAGTRSRQGKAWFEFAGCKGACLSSYLGGAGSSIESSAASTVKNVIESTKRAISGES